jgi:heme-degrading monooxygenase HmoA
METNTLIPFLARISARMIGPAILSLLLFGPHSVSSASAQNRSTVDEPVMQLRIYEIFENNKAAFHERFRDHAMKIMKRYGFVFVATWETKSEGRTEFAYLLRWPDERTMTESWADFMADQEWKDIKKRTGAVHGQFVGEIQDRVLHATDYSPRKRP